MEYVFEGFLKNQRKFFKERRILYCSPSKDGKHSGQCYLTVGKEEKPKLAKCHEESFKLETGKFFEENSDKNKNDYLITINIF